MTAATQLKAEDITKIRGETLSSALTDKERQPDTNFFSGISKFFADAAKAIATSQSWWAKLTRGLFGGGAISASIGAGLAIGTLGGIPGIVIGGITGAVVGGAGVVLAGIIMQGGNPVATVNNAVETVKNVGLATTALLGSFAIQQATGVSLPQMVSGLLNFGDVVYDFNFDIPDSEIWKQINGIIDSLYGQAGQFLGSSFMRFVLTGILSPPKVVMDVNGVALAYSEYSDDKRKELLQGVTNFAWAGLNAAKRIGFLFAFLKGRSAIKLAVSNMPGLKEINPEFVKLVEGWGDEEDQKTKKNEVEDWRISTWVEQKVDSIGNPRIKSFVEGMINGMRDVIEDDVEEYFEFRYA